MLKGKAGIKSTGDKRKSVRVPVELYDEVVKDLSYGAKYSLMTEILALFLKEFETHGNSIVTDFGKLKTRPVKFLKKPLKF